MEVITDKGKINIINKTPHEIKLLSNTDRIIFSLPGTINPPRVKERKNSTKSLLINGKDELKIYTAKNTDVENLPKPQENTYYVVSRLVAEYADRDDLIVPDDFVRDTNGSIIGCKSFKKIERSD